MPSTVTTKGGLDPYAKRNGNFVLVRRRFQLSGLEPESVYQVTELVKHSLYRRSSFRPGMRLLLGSMPG